jgi:hypothetical protein
MLKALDRSVATATERIVLLSPSVAAAAPFSGAVVDAGQHAELVAELQRLRGNIYLKDEAIQRHQLTDDGRHQTPEDDKAWHFLLMDRDDRVTASAVYLEHDGRVRFEDTRAAHNPLMQDIEWRQPLWLAMERELRTARRLGMKYVELGGWAVSEPARGTAAPLALALAVWAFSRRDRGALGLTTATYRHCSATILKRLGGARFECNGHELPAYFDKRYGCMMELLHFDSREPNRRYLSLIDQVGGMLSQLRVVARPSSSEAAAARFAPRPFAPPFATGAIAS